MTALIDLFQSLHTSPIAAAYVFNAVILVPCVITCRRAGISPAWCLWLAIPYIGLVGVIGSLAHRPWPNAKPLRADKQVRDESGLSDESDVYALSQLQEAAAMGGTRD